jgi:3-phenylpropionate/trans-cinnamate dioxygenase ferredoxin reductase subunit
LPDPIVIVGASLAGLRAAQAIRKAGHDGPVVVVGAEPHLPYTRPPLSKELLHGEAEPALPCDDLDVEWRLATSATGLDLARREVELGDERLRYDRLLIATGARARPWAGAQPRGGGRIFTLRGLDDALALKAALREAESLAVIGAGFVGCEVAASARKLGLDVTLVDIAPQPMMALGAELGARCAELHRAHGVTLKLGAPAEVEADVAVAALGAIPNTEWLDGSGLTLRRGVVCDEYLQAEAHVWCAGDVTVWPHPLADGEPIRIEHWTNAAEQGAAAARNLLGERAPYAGVPYFWSDQHDVKIQAAGLPHRAERVEMVEPDVAFGVRGERVVAVVTFNAPRKLMGYRRRLAQMPRVDELLAPTAAAAVTA